MTAYSRRAIVDLMFAAQSPGDVDIAADLVRSLDSGATWADLTTVANRGAIFANRWGAVSNLATLDMNVGQTVRFGVRMGRASGTADLLDSRCNLRVSIGSRTGGASPL